MTDHQLHERIQKNARLERRITARVVQDLAEADRRRLYLKYDCNSLFAYLKKMGYANATAQRRIDAARLHNQIPITEDLASGDLNLTQVSMLVGASRRANVSVEQKKEVIAEIKNQDERSSQIKICEKLNIEAVVHDKKSFQKDGSVRVEVTFSTEQWAIVERVKEVISHTHLNPSLAELYVLCGNEFLKHKDPTSDRKSRRVRNKAADRAYESPRHPASQTTAIGSTGPAASGRTQATDVESAEMSEFRQSKASARREVHQEQGVCQWRHTDGSMCGSRFQLQVDHRLSKWRGGGDEKRNLQMLCAAHNRLKYRREG